MFLWLRRSTRIADLIKDAETVVRGKVVARGEVRLPHVGGTCVFYDLLTESFGVGSRGKGRPMWLPQRGERKCTDFFVDDGTGQVLVAADDESLDVSGGSTSAGPVGKKGKQRFTMRYIREGDTVKVRGLVSAPRGGEPGDRLVIRPGRKDVIELLFVSASR
jgi:hypothetical protein